MATYTQLSDADLKQVALAYGLPAVERATPFSQGSENSNFRLEAGGDSWVLTICENRTGKQVDALVQTLLYLEQHRFETTRIVLTADGETRSTLNGKPLLLKSFIDGDVLDPIPVDLMAALGESIGKLHNIPKPVFLPTEISFGVQTFEPLQREFGKPHAFLDWLMEVQRHVADVLVRSDRGDLPTALIHADIFSDNVVQTKHHGPVIMDFEEATNYYRLFDIGMTIVGTCRRTAGSECQMDQAAQEQLLGGYSKRVQLTPFELSNLNAFIAYAAAGMASWRFRQFNILHPNLGRQDSYRELQKVAEYHLRR
jgi:homoserine kinase type II